MNNNDVNILLNVKYIHNILDFLFPYNSANISSSLSVLFVFPSNVFECYSLVVLINYLKFYALL